MGHPLDMSASGSILIFGATGGLGSKIYESLVEMLPNRTVVGISRTKNNLKGNFISGCDTRDQANVVAAIEKSYEYFGEIVSVVDLTGVSQSTLFSKMDENQRKDIIDVNLLGAMNICSASIPHLRRSQGSLILTSSVVATRPVAGASVYAASKMAIEGLGKSLALELARYNIAVNTIRLGYFNAGMIKDVSEEMQENIISAIPMNRLGDPHEIALTVEFLATNAPKYLSGNVIKISGGY